VENGRDELLLVFGGARLPNQHVVLVLVVVLVLDFGL